MKIYVLRCDFYEPILGKYYEVILNYFKHEEKHTVNFLQTESSVFSSPPIFLLLPASPWSVG